MKPRLLRPLLIAAALLPACPAVAADSLPPLPPFAPGEMGIGAFDVRVHHGPPSVERAAMDNLLSAALSQRSGRSVAEIGALMQELSPPELAQQLGIGEAVMRELFASAHAQLVERARAAGMITDAQAAQLRELPPMQQRTFRRQGP